MVNRFVKGGRVKEDVIYRIKVGWLYCRVLLSYSRPMDTNKIEFFFY